MNDNVEKKNNDGKGITFLTIAILTVVVAIAGSTFAFFQVTASNNNVIRGDSAYVSNALELKVNLSSTNATGKLVPQLASSGSGDDVVNVLQKAVTGATGKGSCVDENGNTICKVYTITVTNKTTTKYYVTGTLTLTAATMPNLKWAKGTSATAGFSGTGTTYTKADTALASNVELASNASVNYYVVVWINETGEAQEDSGSFTGTVQFNGYSTSGTTVSGVTSTIRS